MLILKTARFKGPQFYHFYVAVRRYNTTAISSAAFIGLLLIEYRFLEEKAEFMHPA
jgi:hypothetical protein